MPSGSVALRTKGLHAFAFLDGGEAGRRSVRAAGNAMSDGYVIAIGTGNPV
jgi:hypothetical protein